MSRVVAPRTRATMGYLLAARPRDVASRTFRYAPKASRRPGSVMFHRTAIPLEINADRLRWPRTNRGV